MTLCYLANARLPSEKAHGLQIVENCEALAAEGLEVTLIVPHRKPPPGAAETSDLWSYYGVTRTFVVKRVPCLDLFPLGRRFERLAFAVLTITFAVSSVRAASRTRANVYYSRDLLPLLVLSLLRPRRSLAYEVHQLSSSWFGRRLQRLCARRVGHLFAVTEHLAGDLGADGGRRATVLRDGFKDERFADPPDLAEARRRLGLPTDGLIVGYVGQLRTMKMSKGVDWLVEAIVLLGDPSVHLCVVGGPPDEARALAEYWRARGLAPAAFHAAGQVPPAAVATHLAAFDVGALTLPDTRHFARHASPLKLFEYMAAGLAIVASDLPAVREVLRDGESALLVPPGDVEALAHALRRLRDDPALRRRLGRTARSDVAACAWRIRARRIIDAVRS
jgi:glycosyltransferase involved in cell wall biosynthesis